MIIGLWDLTDTWVFVLHLKLKYGVSILILLNKGYRQAIIQTDNLDVIQALTDLGLEDPGITVFRRTQRIMRVERQWRISYMPRE
ncbi:hypothetical protein Goari_006604 [Gossypium aridum]|uniref:RNase H type-1 domain-containing protein n=1 Tax=Gossypium aridum TaxID=34290 RepID=A0A7J8XQ38_GOSAI|nr:hypothetical protein [Gossypium aridum]